ncbi:hypothetical protein MKW98_029092 [Papaver atlanticum]|uniref:Carotenoid cleavage dioxygenase n=1 Tax=Papaver atlanticum TaxID=357466 RepID=A0AAD4XBP7_9MAGN|nr:hypothetical protein MKW98_029092 [Papaver atlanticum]
MKNVANTGVLKWSGKLLCLWEGGDPYEIDIENGHLDTVGIFDLINRHHLQPEDIASGGVNQISEDAKEVSGDGGGGFWDFAASVVKPILHGIFKMPPKRLLSHYKIDPTLDRLLTVSCNAEDMLIPRSSFTFYECTVEALNNWTKPTDFPTINPSFSGSNNTCIYAATASNSRQSLPHFPFDTVVKLNLVEKSVSTWSVGSRCFIGEPVFVPLGTDEDDEYLVVIEYAVSIQKCYMVILDPKLIGTSEDALVTKLEVPKHLNFPLGFHGFWAAAD